MILFHWSPVERRASIQRRGLVPGSWSTDRLWKPPYVCLSSSPSLAWGLSGAMPRGREIAAWDLWMTHADRLDGYEEIPDDRDGSVKEVRVYHRIYKRDLWLVGTRTSEHGSTRH